MHRLDQGAYNQVAMHLVVITCACLKLAFIASLVQDAPWRRHLRQQQELHQQQQELHQQQQLQHQEEEEGGKEEEEQLSPILTEPSQDPWEAGDEEIFDPLGVLEEAEEEEVAVKEEIDDDGTLEPATKRAREDPYE